MNSLSINPGKPTSWQILVAIALIALPLAKASGFGYEVNTTDDNSNIIACKRGIAGCSLRGAILLANAVSGDDAIFFNLPPGSVIFLTQPLPDISEGVDIIGPGADKLIVWKIAGASDIYLFNVTASGTVNLSGLTIGFQDAFGDRSQGGGVMNSSTGTVNIVSCTIRDNLVSNSTNNARGGGIHNVSGIVNVTNSTLKGNSVLGEPFIGFGGGIYNDSGTVNVTNSTLINNSSLGGCGGGIYNDTNGTLNVTRSTLSGNFAGSDSEGESLGGGAICNGGTLNVVNSTLSGNGMFNNALGHGGNGGGAILNFANNPVNITNSTITGNSVYGTTDFGGGGGIFSDGAAINVKSSIIAMNTSSTSGPDVFGSFHSQGFNLIGKKDGSTGFTAGTDKKGTIALPLDPKLDPKGLRKNGGTTQTIALLASSPAIDKGTSAGLTGALTIDQRGFTRTVDNTSVPNANGGDGTDIGAFELGAQ